MNDLIQSLKKYIAHTLGEELELEKLLEKSLDRLPLYLIKGYTLYKGSIQNKQMIFAYIQDKSNHTPQRLKKDVEVLSNTLKLPIVYVFPALESYNRLRLVEKKIPFVVPQKQLYIPFLIISFTEIKEKKNRSREWLSPASQCILLYHLEIENLDGINFNSIGRTIGYSSMSITRAAEELENFELVKIEGQRRERFLKFREAKNELWNASLQYLTSPVKASMFLRKLPTGLQLLKTYDNALSVYSNLSPGNKPAYAVGPEDFKYLKNELDNLGVDHFEGEIHLEVWKYSPKILSRTDFVDPLSLYLSMKNERDDRIQIALNQLIRDLW